MTDKQIKEEIKQVVTNLCNIEFTVEDELKFCKEVLKRKEQECQKIKNWVKGMMFYTDCSNWFERFTTAFEDWKNDLISQLDQLKAENEKLKEENFTFEQLIKEYEKYGAIEKIVQQLNKLKSENKKLKKVECKFKNYCTCNTEKFLQTLAKIKEIAEADFNHTCWETYARQLKQILQKISEILKDD